jgi:mannose-1-phosphate guanylyltransferase
MNNSNISIVILAGGQGSRFWPLSRSTLPKQFLSLGSSGESMIQATVSRLERMTPREQMVVITSESLVDLVNEHVPGVKVLAEPCGRNTAAAIALGAKWLTSQGRTGVMITLPADHAVQDPDNLVNTLKLAAKVASDSDRLVTIGISPIRPDTGYGYIQRGALEHDNVYAVKRFFEKPNLQRAKKYLESGDFYWNSGMFAWQPEVFMEALKEYLPDMYNSFMNIDFSKLAEVYESVESISVDFGIMEHARNVSVVEAYPFGWSDVGSWDAWAEHFTPDENSNMLKGDCVALEGSGNIVSAAGRFIALVGAEDMVVIDSPDALLVCPRSRVQEVRKVVDYLKTRGRKDLI